MNMLAQLRSASFRVRLQLPVVALITLLQRTPVARVVTAACEYVAASPAGALLRGVAATASLGAMHSLAGATTLVASAQSPVSFTVGNPITPIAFTVSDTINIGSWRLGGTMPPGLRLEAQNGNTLTGPGVLDATVEGSDDGYGVIVGGVPATIPLLLGTPSAAGSYTITLQAIQPAGLQGLMSAVFNYTITIAASTSSNVIPSFTAQPAAQTVSVGGTITLSGSASGTPAPTYQWERNGVAIAGATSATLTINNAQTSDAGSYRLVATNTGGVATSSTVAVAVNVPSGGAPTIARQPVGLTVSNNSTAVFTVQASGTTSPTYQWSRNGAAIAGATSATLVISAATTANAGNYTVTVGNGAGASVTSSAASLAISTDSNFGRLINLSISTSVTTADPFFTVGTVVGGAGTTGSKALLIRAVGPTLGAFGVPGTISDPKMEVFSGSASVATNDNWGGGATLANAFAAVGAFAMDASSRDAAVFNPSLAAGGYTVQVSGVGGATGSVLAELYDATPAGSFTATTPRLINVSVSKQISTGGSLTAGFVIGGGTARTVLVRAIGPGLAAFGLGGTMADPKLSLFSGSNTIAENDNWGGDAQITASGTAVGAFAIADAAGKDAMILITLAPGNYTTTVSGTGAGGTALVEVYEVP
jgi:hypothetical protein